MIGMLECLTLMPSKTQAAAFLTHLLTLNHDTPWPTTPAYYYEFSKDKTAILLQYTENLHIYTTVKNLGSESFYSSEYSEERTYLSFFNNMKQYNCFQH